MDNLEYTIRLERPDDYFEVEKLTRAAFMQFTPPREPLGPGLPNCSEHLLAHRLRGDDCFVPELDFVAVEADGTLIGNIMYSRAVVQGESGTEAGILTFGPLSVLPEKMGRGVGEALVRHSLAEAARMGYKGVFIFGHPGYYPRLGFVPAEVFGITDSEGKNYDAFMGLELYPGALEGVQGRLKIGELFFEDSTPLLAEFERRFA